MKEYHKINTLFKRDDATAWNTSATPIPSNAELVEICHALLKQWNSFNEEKTYVNAYYKLAKYAREDWEKLETTLAQLGALKEVK